MVLHVCRSILGDEHDAEDAFQATFLVLIRQARAVRRRASVASWLHGVALRVSARARADLARCRRHDRRAGAAILHEELGRLPERYRAAVVLCHLEGNTCEAAARRLGWPVGTVSTR
jgi:DNA-directed RNA polymerase specialized sigma24 family protein